MPDFFPFLLYVLVTTFTPGPNNILSMSNALHDGYRRTLRFLAGVAVGFLVVMGLASAFDLALVNLVPQMRLWLNIFGALYMVYLAVHIARSKPQAEAAAPGALNTFKAGFLLQFVNLKCILFGITVFSIYITPVFQEPGILFLFALLLSGVAFLAVSTWALGGNLFRSFLSRYERVFNLAMAALLVYTAAASLFLHPL
jgi:threonine/homoserine/homoserine lactone efflux protein